MHLTWLGWSCWSLFGLIVSLLGFALSLYSLGYVRGFFGRKNVGMLGMFFNLMLLATTLVVMADNAFFFLMAWEIMALTAYCLVSFEHEKPETRSAGVLYFVDVAHRNWLHHARFFAAFKLPEAMALPAFMR